MLPGSKQKHLARAGAVMLSFFLISCTADQGTDRATDRESTSPSPSPSQAPHAKLSCRERVRRADPEKFIPATRREGTTTILPVVYPDGSRAELSYPSALKLAQIGVQPTISLGIDKPGPRIAHARFLLISKTPVDEVRSDDPAVETYDGASGEVKVWRPEDPKEFLNPSFLHFGIGTWNVFIGDGNAGTFMGRANRRLWAENLEGYETKNGFIVFEPQAPLEFAVERGEPNLLFSTCFRFLEFRLEKCKDLKHVPLAKRQTKHLVDGMTVHRNRSGRSYHANWCIPSRNVSVYVSARGKRFVDLAVMGLRVTDVVVVAEP